MSPDILQLSRELAVYLQQTNTRVTAAESCTGGLVAAALTALPGSSTWFDMGFVVYSDHAKRQLLGVDAALLIEQGAVSEGVVLAMAKEALFRAQADFAVSISGIAGPGGGSLEKPVGMVWLAWASTDHCLARCFHFQGDRDAVREASTLQALTGLLQLVRQKTV